MKKDRQNTNSAKPILNLNDAIEHLEKVKTRHISCNYCPKQLDEGLGILRRLLAQEKIEGEA